MIVDVPGLRMIPLVIFEVRRKRKVDLPIGYQETKYHMIFDIKLGEDFSRKARLVGGGNTAYGESPP